MASPEINVDSSDEISDEDMVANDDSNSPQPSPGPEHIDDSDIKDWPTIPAEAVDVTPQKNGKVKKFIEAEGTGTAVPLAGCKVSVHYTGRLVDGTEFDSSIKRNEAFEFDLGKEQVIKAWDLGVATMKQGEKCKLYCHPEYAYGKKGSKPNIPENSFLVFDVELLSWHGEDLSEAKDGGIERVILEKGEGYKTPRDCEQVEVHIIGSVKGGAEFINKQITFVLGEGSDHGIPIGLEKAIMKFKKNEKSEILLKPEYGFGAVGNVDLNVPGGAELHYVVHLVKMEKVIKESWELQDEEKLEQAEFAKTRGTMLFKKGNYVAAGKWYKKVVDFLQYWTPLPKGDLDAEAKEKEEQKQKQAKDALLLAGYLNLAMTHLKMDDGVEAAKHCEKAIEIDANNEKALYRHGLAQMLLHDYEKGQSIFKRVLELNPANKAATNQLKECTRKIREEQQREKKLYAGIFSKLFKSDENAAERVNGEAPAQAEADEVKIGDSKPEDPMESSGIRKRNVGGEGETVET